MIYIHSLGRAAHQWNVSRGRLIHTKALIKALKSGHVGGVALDVYEEEEGIFFEDLSGKILQDDELARLLTFSQRACYRASGFSNARSPQRDCPSYRRKCAAFCEQTGITRRN